MRKLGVAIVVALALFGGVSVSAQAKGKLPLRHAQVLKSPKTCIGSPGGKSPAFVPRRLMCGGQIPPPYCSIYNQGQWWYGSWHTWNNPAYYFTKWWICGYAVYPSGLGFAAWL